MCLVAFVLKVEKHHILTNFSSLNTFMHRSPYVLWISFQIYFTYIFSSISLTHSLTHIQHILLHKSHHWHTLTHSRTLLLASHLHFLLLPPNHSWHFQLYPTFLTPSTVLPSHFLQILLPHTLPYWHTLDCCYFSSFLHGVSCGTIFHLFSLFLLHSTRTYIIFY